MNTGAGAAGAFSNLLQAYPALATWISDRVRDKRVALQQISTDEGLRTRLAGLKHLHNDFLSQCRAVGLSARDYPFNTEQLGVRSLSAAVRAECLHYFGRGARLAGATHLKGMPTAADAAPAATQALDVVEFDGHRLDVRLKVVVRDPLGFEQEFEIERIWLLVIIDVWSRAVLGYHVSLNREYSRYDVIRTIEAALEPHRNRVADDLWHELILYTRHYQVFCQRAFGRFLHHRPAVVLGGNRSDNVGIRRCWRQACLEENINPRRPTRLPLLFALDQKLDIPNGFRYVADCEAARRAGREGSGDGGKVYCGGDFSSPSFDGATDGLDSDSGGGADGGDDGGGGCGGGGD